ncbi:MAG: iron uptake porin, partial [Kovacikia sp.]
AALRGQVDALEARTATLEKQQFSTTTKLNGEVIFAITDTFGDRATRNGSNGRLTGVTARNEASLRDDQTNTIFADRVRLSFDTSFTGKDRLRTRLNARNVTPFSGALTGTNQTRLAFDGNDGNAVGVDKLYYRFPVGDKLRIQVDALNDEVYDGLISSLSPFESSGSGSISRFGRFNPVLRINNPGSTGSAGITFAYKFSDAFRFEGGYLSDTASNDPSAKNGLFNGAYAAIAQAVFTTGNFTFGVNYSHSYYPGGGDVNLTGSTGSTFASNPFGQVATSADTVGGSVQYKFSPQFILGGWAGASFAHRRSNSDNATVLNAAVYAAFPDFGKEGNLLGILAGLPPRVIDNEGLTIAREDREAYSVHLEGFYRYRINDNIAITPGIFVIFNPENNARNDTQFVGVLRTTFTF